MDWRWGLSWHGSLGEHPIGKSSDRNGRESPPIAPPPFKERFQMRQGGGKNKGGNFERDMCRRLSEWATGTSDPVAFWRSSASGAKATIDRKAGRVAKMDGDMMSIAPECAWLFDHFYFEFKFYKKLDWSGFLRDMKSCRMEQRTSQIWKWLNKYIPMAENKILLLVVKENFKEPDILVHIPDTKNVIKRHQYTLLRKKLYPYFSYKDAEFIFMSLDYFLNNFSYKDAEFLFNGKVVSD
jgi:hypothetical protein